jgi:hypothetical protein
VLREIFGAKREEMTEHWRKFRDDELYDLYSAQNIILLIK